jgi:stearoyl-CoA desaturase (delta-9 desaturase)
VSIIDIAPPPEPASSRPPVDDRAAGGPPRYHQVLSVLVALIPLVVGTMLVAQLFSEPFPWMPVLVTLGFIVVIGHGVTVGFHRLFTHHSFVANRPLKITLAVLGTLSFQGSLIGWVADHRRHHRFSDRPGDPHSPMWTSTGAPTGGWRGLWHAHFGWCLTNTTTSREQYARDLLADPDLVMVDRLFLPLCVVTVTLPFVIGYVLGGTTTAAVATMLWAGVFRVSITHNFTWSINSVCHRFGRRSFPTTDLSTNVAWLAPFTMGEAWHNNHHAFPRSARHGLDRGQLDTSAFLIGLFERLGWATSVQWPDAALVAARRAG